MSNRTQRPLYRCSRCDLVEVAEEQVTVTPGSGWMELLLWILFFPIGIIYSLWRIIKRYNNGCPECLAPMYRHRE